MHTSITSVLLRHLSSLKLTLIVIVMMAIAVIVADYSVLTQTWMLAVPLVLLALNLCLSILTTPQFRRQTPLLLFHLCLLAVLILVALGRMTYLVGQVSLLQDETFNGQLDKVEKGPWHLGKLDEVRFMNSGFNTEFIPSTAVETQLFRKSTENSIQWIDSRGQRHQGVIGDDHPLVLNGFRFYTSTNLGYALRFTYLPHDRSKGAQPGVVYLNSYLSFKDIQGRSWELPDNSETVWAFLEFDEEVLKSGQQSKFHAPENHHVIVGFGDQEQDKRIMVDGDSIELSSGTLYYRGLTTWMGYRVVYDWTLNWIAAASVLAVLSLIWFYWQRFMQRSWLKGEDRERFNQNEGTMSSQKTNTQKSELVVGESVYEVK